jgi:hypothetical protein
VKGWHALATKKPQQEKQSPLPRTHDAVNWWLNEWIRTEPLTREDVECLIKKNLGTAEGLDLGRRRLLRADLSGVNLEGAELNHADLRGANMSNANFHGANLRGADLRS